MNNANRNWPRRGGFTLIEVAIATVVIAVGVTALMSTLRAGTTVNATSSRMTTGMFLAQNIHEWTMHLSFENVMLVEPDPDAEPCDNAVVIQYIEDLHGKTFSPPRDGTGSGIGNQTGWAQTVRLSWREADNLQREVDGPTDVIHVSVGVSYNGGMVTTMNYLLFKRIPPTIPEDETDDPDLNPLDPPDGDGDDEGGGEGDGTGIIQDDPEKPPVN